MLRLRAALSSTLTLILVAAAAVQVACGSETQADASGGAIMGGSSGSADRVREGADTGGVGVSTGGATTGGAATSTGGASSGGTTTGGVATSTGSTPSTGGGSTSTGVPASGGAATGGAATSTGGASSGGTSRGGVDAGATGGLGTGGAMTGGTGNAGAPAGGRHTGGASTGGTGTGGASSGGEHTGGAATGGTGPLSPVTIYIASDSTAATYTDTASPNDQAGWGQMLHEVFSSNVTIVNKSAGGRTARWFYLEGAVDSILKTLEPGDYLFVQFGTNDGNKDADFTVNGTTYPRYAAPDTDFKTYLKDYYLTPVRAKEGIVVFVTPPPRNSAYCGNGNSLAGYAEAMRQLGTAEDVPVIDLNAKTFDYLSSICPSPTPEDFFFVRTDGTVDGTHFQENGARQMAEFIAACVRELHLALEGYLLP